MDKFIRMISGAMLKIINFATSLGGFGLIALVMAYASAMIDGVTVANFFSANMVMKMQAENPGITEDQARMMGHVYLQGISTWVIFALAACAFFFRIAPSKDQNSFLKNASKYIGVLLGIVGTIGMADAVIIAHKGHSILTIFANGRNLIQFGFGAVIAWIPTIIIEAISIHLDKEYKELIKTISDNYHQKLAAQVESEISEQPKKRNTPILTMSQPAKTGTI